MTEQSLIADYADLGVSCGYIGGVGIHGDDRSFRVFVRLAREPHRQMADVCVHVFTVPYEQRLTWKYDEAVVQYDTPAIRAKLDEMRAGLAKGELFLTTDMVRKLALKPAQTKRFVTAVSRVGQYMVGIVTDDGRIRVDYHGDLSTLKFYETRWYDPKNPWAGGQPEDSPINLEEAGLRPDWT